MAELDVKAMSSAYRRPTIILRKSWSMLRCGCSEKYAAALSFLLFIIGEMASPPRSDLDLPSNAL
jgi:hypothetical protein